MKNKFSIDSELFLRIEEGKELEHLADISFALRQTPISESEFEFYKEKLTTHEHYYNELPLSKYMAGKDLIAYFKITIQSNNIN